MGKLLLNYEWTLKTLKNILSNHIELFTKQSQWTEIHDTAFYNYESDIDFDDDDDEEFDDYDNNDNLD